VHRYDATKLIAVRLLAVLHVTHGRQFRWNAFFCDRQPWISGRSNQTLETGIGSGSLRDLVPVNRHWLKSRTSVYIRRAARGRCCRRRRQQTK